MVEEENEETKVQEGQVQEKWKTARKNESVYYTRVVTILCFPLLHLPHH